MDSVTLASIVGVVLSLAFSYIPGLNSAFSALAAQSKQLVMGILLIVVAAAIFGLSCAGLGSSFGISVACTSAGAVDFVKVLIAALISNQTTYTITRK